MDLPLATPDLAIAGSSEMSVWVDENKSGGSGNVDGSELESFVSRLGVCRDESKDFVRFESCGE